MITNRILIYMTGLVIAGMIVLFILNMTSILSGHPGAQIYLKYNDVRGIAIKHKNLLYTLNFEQQKEVIERLNDSIPIAVTSLDQKVREPTEIEQIIIYQFNDKPNLIIAPIAYLDHQLVYSMPNWDSKEYLMELSQGKLQKLLSQTYDH